MYHVCSDVGNGAYTKFDFLCPNGTVFNQQEFVCDWWFNVDCSTSDSYYDLNIEVAEKNAERQRLRELERDLGEEDESVRAELSADQVSQLFAGGDKPALQPSTSAKGAQGSEGNKRQGSGTSAGSSRRPGTGNRNNRGQKTSTRQNTKTQSKKTGNRSQKNTSKTRNQAQNTRFKSKNTRANSANKRNPFSNRKQKSQNSFTSFGSSSAFVGAPEATKSSSVEHKNPFSTSRGNNDSKHQPTNRKVGGRGTPRFGKLSASRPGKDEGGRQSEKKGNGGSNRSNVKAFTAFGNGQSRTFRGKR